LGRHSKDASSGLGRGNNRPEQRQRHVVRVLDEISPRSARGTGPVAVGQRDRANQRGGTGDVDLAGVGVDDGAGNGLLDSCRVDPEQVSVVGRAGLNRLVASERDNSPGVGRPDDARERRPCSRFSRRHG
jgi:hypothetical protein